MKRFTTLSNTILKEFLPKVESFIFEKLLHNGTFFIHQLVEFIEFQASVGG